MANCQRCEERHDRIRQATYLQDGYCLCEDCCDAMAEAAHERMLSDFYGGAGCVTVQEQYDAAAKQKREWNG